MNNAPKTNAAWESLFSSGESWNSIAEKIKVVSQDIECEHYETLRLGNKLAYECERILGLGLHQNTIERFEKALEDWKQNA